MNFEPLLKKLQEQNLSENRKPILLNHHACALIMIYKHTDEVFDAVYSAYENFCSKECYDEAAKEFIKQLEGYWNPGFLKALRNEIDEVLKGK